MVASTLFGNGDGTRKASTRPFMEKEEVLSLCTPLIYYSCELRITID